MKNSEIGALVGGDRVTMAAALGGTSPAAAASTFPRLDALRRPLRSQSLVDRLGSLRDWSATLQPGALGGDRLVQRINAALAAIPPAIEYEVIVDET